MPDLTPLLTIAIPTFDRADYLRESLSQLLPQLIAAHRQYPGEVEFLVSDNASTDGTAAVLDEAETVLEAAGARGLFRRMRQADNIGSDRNFVYCFRQAGGRYFWLCGDDDILRPGAVAAVLEAVRTAAYDWIFLPPEPFQTNWREEFRPDPYGRQAQVVTSAREMALRVNVMITFISGMVVHRERLLTLLGGDASHAAPVEAPEAFIGTHLTQLSWTLPLLRDHRQSLILWQRFVLGRQMNGGGYSIGEVFGGGFVQTVRRLLPGQPRLTAIFSNIALRQWFPATMLELRQNDRGNHFALHEAEDLLRTTFGGNFRYWLFTWPVLRLPLGLAALWQRAGGTGARLLRLLHHPDDVERKLRSLAAKHALRKSPAGKTGPGKTASGKTALRP